MTAVMTADATRRSRRAPLVHRRLNWFALFWHDDRLSTNRSVSAVPVQLHDTPLACAVVVAFNEAPFCVMLMVSVPVWPTVESSVPCRHSPPVTLVRVSANVQMPATWTRVGVGAGVGLGDGVGVLESFPQAASEKPNRRSRS